MNLFIEYTSIKDTHREAVACRAGDAQPCCYSTCCHNLQTAPGIVARNAAQHFLKSNAAKRQELQHLGTRLIISKPGPRTGQLFEFLQSQ